MSEAVPAARPAPRRLSLFSPGRQWRLTRKELAETLRDRRTIVTLVLMPILVYPLLSIIFRQFLVGTMGRQEMAFVIAVDNEAQQETLERWLHDGESLLQRQVHSPEQAVSRIEPPLVDEPAFNEIAFAIGDAEETLRSGQADVLVRIGGEFPFAEVTIVYAERSAMAGQLRSFIERRLRALNQAVAAARREPPPVIAMHHSTIPSPPPRSLLPSIVPLVLLLMTITGAVYPAIDLTAGERERGTLEALVAAPVSRMGLLMAKYVAVLTVALLTAGVNLIAMSITIYSAGLAGLVVGADQPVWLLAVKVFGLLLLFASFFSAVLLAVTSFAKSFKEAQAYLIPLMLFTLGPGLLSLSPAMELGGLLAFVPLVNVVLLARDVFAGTATLASTAAVVVSTLLYAVAAIAVAARIFGSDAILYGSGGSWTELFRRPQVPLNAPSLGAAALAIALLIAGTVNIGGTISMMTVAWHPAAQIGAGALVTLLLFGMTPLVATWIEHVRFRAGFRLGGSSVRYFAAAVLMGLSLGILVMQLIALANQWSLFPISPALEALIREKGTMLDRHPLALVLLALAVAPAIAEEWFFRGYLFRALEARSGAAATILLSSLAFAALHVFGAAGVMLPRLLPSLLMGLALGWLAWRSGSVWPGMLLHALNNSLLLSIARYREELAARGLLPLEGETLPTAWLVAATIVALVGAALVAWPRGDKPEAA
jgi:sodium transport system permease protein